MTPSRRQISIIGVPLDLGAGHRGVDMGPSAIRVTGLKQRIEALGFEVCDTGDVGASVAEATDVGAEPSLRFAEPVLATCRALAEAVGQALSGGCFPLVIGGDHSLAMGSLAAAAAHVAERGQSLGLIWIDAHADMNTPQTTPSGNLHGMGLAVALGHGDPRFVDLVRPGRKIDPRHVALVAVRDLDPPEREALQREGVTVLTMRDIDERGMYAVMNQAIAVVTGGALSTGGALPTDGALPTHGPARAGTPGDQGVNGAVGPRSVYVEFDMDAVSPDVAPGTGTPVPGGLSFREAHLAMEMLGDTGRVLGLDVVETNPALDVRNQTAELATGLILSLLGKRIYRNAGAGWGGA